MRHWKEIVPLPVNQFDAGAGTLALAELAFH